MDSSASSGFASAVQSVVALVVVAMVAWAPPSHGSMLVVPLFPTMHPLVVASRAGAMISGRGRLPGSWVVFGDRARILRAALASGNIVVASAPAGCGTRRAP